MKKKKIMYLLYLLAYAYIFFVYSYIIYYISYTVRITNKGMGWFSMVFNALLCYIAYAAINHLLIRKLISNKLLIIIEALLFVAMLTLIISDLMYDAYQDLKYLQRTMTTNTP